MTKWLIQLWKVKIVTIFQFVSNLLFVPLYICIFVYEFYLEYIVRNQYMYVKTKRTYVKKNY
jgi:hypothetical protein